MFNKNKPRIAFCFSGQARTLDQTYLFFQKNLFDAAKDQGFDYDVFCAVEDDEDADKVKLLNPSKVEKIKSSDVEKIIEEKYGKDWRKIFEDYVFWKASMRKENDVYRYMQQLYKVSSSINMAKQHHYQYDIVVRLRFDCVFFNKIDLVKIKDYVSTGNVLCNKGTFFVPYKSIQKRLLIINDMFFFGNEKSIFLLGNMFDNLYIALKGGEPNKFISKIFSYIKATLISLNDKLNRWIFPILPILFLESFFYKVFTCENCYYYYFKNQGIKCDGYNFSWLILRNQCSKTCYNFVDKNKFEL